MVRIRFLVFSVLPFLLSSVALQAQQFTVTNHILVSTQRASLFQYTYTYQISAVNTGPDAAGATCVVTSKSPQTIVVSGNLKFGAMPSGSTVASTTTLVLTQDRRYPLSWPNLQWEWSSVDASSAKVIGIEGGTVSVQNHLGDTLTLDIPPLALAEGTSISVSPLQTPLPSPIAQNVYPGIILEPEGLRFSLPVKMKVTFHNVLTTPAAAMLFWRLDADHVLPLPNQSTTQNGIEGDIYHFSGDFAGVPSPQELAALIASIEALPSSNTPASILDKVNALLTVQKYGDLLSGYGDLATAAEYEDLADIAMTAAQTILTNESTALLSAPLPSNPCGQNSVDVLRLGAAISSLLGDTSLANQVNARACTFTVSPNSLSLYQGERDRVLTATLLDPNGNQRSCAVLNWYSANLNVVGIGPLHNPTVGVIGVGPGVANVSANCDGLLAASLVSVAAGYIGTFTAVGQTYVNPCVWNVSWPQTLAVFLSGPSPSFYDMGTLTESGNCNSASGAVNYMDVGLTVSGSTIYGSIGHAGETGGIITIFGQVDQAAGTVTGTWQWDAGPGIGGAQANFILYATTPPSN